ncbi:MAG: DNA-directed RNA polymerase subunit beta [Minisyncoccia bacterium]
MPTTKIFSKYNGPIFEQPNLIEIQLNSYQQLLQQGIRELFDEISPIIDYNTKNIELYFLDYKFDAPKYTEMQAREKGLNYEAAWRVNLKLVNKETKKEYKQEIFFGDFPMMTERGTFIINGVERVVLPQLIRSYGVYFLSDNARSLHLFGAKVIPNRGAWLEFNTEADGFIGVKIDRQRKVAVTDLLRIFGLESDEAILKTFKDVDNGKIKFIEETLKKDGAHTVLDSYLEIYKRLRPGELGTAEISKSFVDAIFKRPDRYDLGKVGRYKLNQRLNLQNNRGGLLDLEDLIAIVKEIIKLNNTDSAEPDDIDHLGNRRLRAVGELVENRMRVGLARLHRVIQDRMSVLDKQTLQPAQLINSKVLMTVITDFFISSSLSQFMEQVNPLAELENKRKISVLGQGGLVRERAGFEVRDVHPSYYGRICPIQTPEGPNIGLVNTLASYARLNKFGFLETPYFKVKNKKITNEVVWLDAFSEMQYKIAQADIEIDDDWKIKSKYVIARYKDEPIQCLASEVDLVDVSPNQIVSVATSLIPFLEHDDAHRALMGSNMQKQAVPSIKPSIPLVSTGQEEKAAIDSGQVIKSDVDGEVIDVDAQKIVIKLKDGKTKTFELIKFKRTNQSTALIQIPIVQKGDKVKVGDIIADGPATKNGVLSLGQNLLVAFIPWHGGNYEDAVILSERVVQEDLFTSIHIDTFECLVRDTRLGPEIITPDIPNVSEDKLRNLDGEGIIRIGAEVKPNDILVGKISPKGEAELSSEEKLLRAIFGEKARDVKDSSLYLPNGKRGRVIGIKVFSRDFGDKLDPGIIKKIEVEIAQIRRIKTGDKLTGRHGNKGVISMIRPVEDMPYLEDGTPVDVILNPLGVASRMNLGQILETHLGFAAKILGYRAIVPNFIGANDKEIQKELKAAGLPEDGKVTLFDGLTGQAFRDKIMVGYIYMMKLNHLVEDKIHMRSTGPYSLITQQPLGGKAQLGGQRVGEMEVWALEGYGAAYTLQEMLTIKSDDVIGRSAVYESIIRGQEVKSPNIPAAFNVLVNELKSLGLNVVVNYEELKNQFKQNEPKS